MANVRAQRLGASRSARRLGAIATDARRLSARTGRSLLRLYSIVQRRMATEHVLVLGDSHARVFRHWWILLTFPRTHFSVCAVSGATASGLANPNSLTQAMPIYRRAIGAFKGSRIVVLLGEVDTGFVIWYRAQRHGVPVEQMLAQAVERYTQFLSELRERAGRVIVVSAPLPTIDDGNDLSEVGNLRREVIASLRARTQLTLAFNDAVRAFTTLHGIGFVDLDAGSTGPDGTVRRQLKNRSRIDHHYDQYAYARLLEPKLVQVW